MGRGWNGVMRGGGWLLKRDGGEARVYRRSSKTSVQVRIVMNTTGAAEGRSAGQYGFGFTYGNTLFDLGDSSRNEKEEESALRQAISDRAYDVVVFSFIHRGPPPFMKDFPSLTRDEREQKTTSV